ncbi:MAG: hypothetical protein ACE5GG_02180, partial [Candidatus Omnitrophota bacterium]
ALNNLNGGLEIFTSAAMDIEAAVVAGRDIALTSGEKGAMTAFADIRSRFGGRIGLGAGGDFLQAAGIISTAGDIAITADYDGGGRGDIIQAGGSVSADTLWLMAPGNIALNRPDNDVARLRAFSAMSGDIGYRDRSGLILDQVEAAQGTISIEARGDITATYVDSSFTDSGLNDITLTSAQGDIQAIWINAGTRNDVFLNASSGAVTQDGLAATDVIAGGLIMDTAYGIDLDSEATVLLVANSLSGDITIDNLGDLYAQKVLNQGGDIKIATHSDLFVGEIQTKGDNDVYLAAAGGSIWDDLFADSADLNYIRGDLVDLSASKDIGNRLIPNGDIDVRANIVNVSCGGDLALEEKDGAIFNNIFVGGKMGLVFHGLGVLGNITADGFVDIEVPEGDIIVTTGTITSNTSGVRLTTDTGSIYAQGPGPHIVANGDSFLNAPQGKISPDGAPLNVFIRGDLYLDIANLFVTYPTREVYGNLIGTINPLGTPLLIPTSFPQPLNPPGFVYFNAKQIWPPKSNADYQWLSQQVASRNKNFIVQYRQESYNNPRFFREVTRVAGDYFESLEGFRFASFNPTPSFYAYHPLTPVDASAFEGIALDIGAYEFIEDKIDLKEELSPYLLYPGEEERKRGEDII